MFVSILTIQNGSDGREVYDEQDFVGDAREIAKTIAHFHGQNQAMVNQKVLTSYTIITWFMDNSGRVWVA